MNTFLYWFTMAGLLLSMILASIAGVNGDDLKAIKWVLYAIFNLLYLVYIREPHFDITIRTGDDK